MGKLLKYNYHWDSTVKQRVLAAAGIVGPVLYTITWLLVGFLDPTYNHIRDPISNLSAIDAPFALIMTTIILVFAFLIVVFALALHRGLPTAPGSWSWTGPAALIIAGVGYVGIALAPLSLADPEDQNLPHTLSATVTVFSFIFAPLLLSPRLKLDPKWQNFRVYSIATTAAALLVVFVIPAFLPGFLEWGAGLMQRLILSIILIWMIVIAFRLLRQTKPLYPPHPKHSRA